jgi:hypothetical protein
MIDSWILRGDACDMLCIAYADYLALVVISETIEDIPVHFHVSEKTEIILQLENEYTKFSTYR